MRCIKISLFFSSSLHDNDTRDIILAGLGVVVGIIYLIVDIYGLYKAYQNCNIYFARKKYVAFVKDMRAKFDKLENATKDSTEKLTSLLDNYKWV